LEHLALVAPENHQLLIRKHKYYAFRVVQIQANKVCVRRIKINADFDENTPADNPLNIATTYFHLASGSRRSQLAEIKIIHCPSLTDIAATGETRVTFRSLFWLLAL
jgi:hypothetical protein